MIALWEHLPRLKARRKREQLLFHPDVRISPDDMVTMIEAEFGDKELAQKMGTAQLKRLDEEARARQGQGGAEFGLGG